ncbi:MAG: response regulator [Lachnospiraceae bacterium]|nr:response regulator [Lachnospiraceae bacterium]
MQITDLMVSGSYYFSFAALIFMIMFFMIAFINKTENTKTLKLLIWAAVFGILGCLSEFFANISIRLPEVSEMTPAVLYTINLSSMLVCAAYFNKYTVTYIIRTRNAALSYRLQVISYSIIISFHVLLAANFFVHFIFDIDENGFVFKPLNYLFAYILPVLYLLSGISIIIYKRNELNKREFSTLFSTHIIVMAGAVFQGIIEDRVLLISFFITVGLYIVYTFVESPDYRKLVETSRKFEEAEKKATAANAAKSGFLFSMSHEIRTPMNAVIGMNELTRLTLLDDTISDKDKISRALEYSGSIQSAGESLLYIINDILDASKIESGKMTIVDAPYHLMHLLDDICETFTYEASNKDLMFISHIDGDLPGYVRGDKLRVKQIITNIVNNAIKYTKAGSVSLDISGKVMGDTVRYDIAVTDTGIGIKKESIPHIFDTFERVDDEDTHFIEGTGLGLSIVKNLLEMMGGSVEVESEYGKGSVFTLHIPQTILSNEKLSEYNRESARPESADEQHIVGGGNILVVDDTRSNLVLARSFLERMGATVKTVTSGAEALPLIQNVKYDLIFLDFMMPGMGGDKVLEEIKSDPVKYSVNGNTPVIAMTANVAEGLKEKYINEYGFTDYMTKPFKYSELLEMVSGYMDVESHSAAEPSDKKAGDHEERPLAESPEGKSDIEDIDHIDVEAGLELCGEMEIYKSIIETYIEESDRYKKDLKDSFGEKDMENFAITVHALKSSSMSLGAKNFAGCSLEMETAAKNGDTDFITGNFEDYYNCYENVINGFKKILSA